MRREAEEVTEKVARVKKDLIKYTESARAAIKVVST
jgi:hypothetical protein